MKTLTLAIDNNSEVQMSGNLSLQEASNLIETIMRQQVFEAGMEAEKQRIRKGFKAKRQR